jgi:hypothetical protein
MIKFIITAALLMHGIGHALFVANAWGAWRTDTGHSWLLSGALHFDEMAQGIFGLLWFVPLAGFLAGAWGYFNQVGTWWQPLLLVSAVTSASLVVVWWNGIDVSSAYFAIAFDTLVIVVTLWAYAISEAALGS